MTVKKKYDFSGIATAYEIKCGDDRTIARGCFDHQSGTRVPIVWRHSHDDMSNVLGHGILTKDELGIRVLARLNRTDSGRRAKELVVGGDITSLSVWANNLKQEGNRVIHGTIREVSLVLSGQNPGAKIDEILIHNDDDEYEEGVIIHSGSDIVIWDDEVVTEEKDPPIEEVVEEETQDVLHEAGDENDETDTLADVLKTLNDEQFELVSTIIHAAITGQALQKGDAKPGEGPTVSEVLSSLTPKQQKVLHFLVGTVSKDSTLQQSDTDGGTVLTYNIFEGNQDEKALIHGEMKKILFDAMNNKVPSLGDLVLEHAGTYGIDNVNLMFPEAMVVGSKEPYIFSDNMEWVGKVMNGVHKSPFSRIKSLYADVTADEARAMGYVTGDLKIEQVFPILSRSTDPQTVFKKQKLDRDDVRDITSFDVVRWLKKEMMLLLREELARAIMITDGRSVVDPNKIMQDRIRPIYEDDPIYTHQVVFGVGDTILDIIDGITSSREHYRGSGSPSLFVAPGLLASMLTVRDTTNRRIYDTVDHLKGALRVSDIVEIPKMTGVTRSDDATLDLLALMVNLRDYTIGADRGGETAFFDDFDIDYNQYKYLYETRLSGALTRPKSAISFEQDNV